MDILFSRTIPHVIGIAIECAIREHIYDLAEAVKNGVDVSLSTGTAIPDAIRIGVENALTDAAEGILPNAELTRPEAESNPTDTNQ